MPAQEAEAATPAARVTYPSNRLANVADLSANQPLDVAYPDDDAPGVLLKLGKSVDIVGFSTICPHKGYPVNYDADSQTLNCPGHYSVFEVETGGQLAWVTPHKTCRNTCFASMTAETFTPRA